MSFNLVSECDATHCSRARALQTLLLAGEDSVGGDSVGYIEMISCSSAEIVPNECHSTGARSGKVSRRLLSSTNAFSRCQAVMRRPLRCEARRDVL